MATNDKSPDDAAREGTANPLTAAKEGTAEESKGEAGSPSSSGGGPGGLLGGIKSTRLAALATHGSKQGKTDLTTQSGEAQLKDGEADDDAGEILGFPKDSGPPGGVKIKLLSFARAMHVRNLNHPHIVFERRGTWEAGSDEAANKVWKCLSDGFSQLKVGL